MRKLTSQDLIPVNPTYAGDDKISFDMPTEITTSNGYNYYQTHMMNSLSDFKFNKYSFMGLLSTQDIGDVLVDDIRELQLTGPVFITPISGKVLGVDDDYDIVDVDIEDELAKLFVFQHITAPDGSAAKYYAIQYRDSFLSYTASGAVFKSKITGDTQLFRIVDAGIDDYTFNLITVNDEVLEYDNDDRFKISTDNSNFIPFDERVSVSDGFTTENRWIRYAPFYSPAYSINLSTLDVDDNESLSGVRSNYVVSAPVDGISIFGATATLPCDILPTKNYKTIGGDLSLISDDSLSGPELVDFRDYKRIYTGGNQIDGYSNINLGFESNYSSALVFEPAVYTYFHAPMNVDVKSIQDVGFEYAGASVSNLPSESDRIYKKLADYKDKVWWGGGSEDRIQNGSWLCAWLSGDGGDTSQWVERYYNPGEINKNDAFDFETGRVETDAIFTPNAVPVFDVVSNMTIEPGAYYRYYHVGDRDAYVDLSDGVLFKLNFGEITTDGEIFDESGNGNEGYISNLDQTLEVTMDVGFDSINQDALLVNGSSNISVPTSTVLAPEDKIIVANWVYSKSWAESRTATMYDNFHKGGYKAEVINHGPYYSYIIPSTSPFGPVSELMVVPSEIQTEAATDLVQVANDKISGTVVSCAVDLDGNFICIANDLGESVLFKLAPDGRVLESINYNDVVLKQVVIKDDNVAYVSIGSSDVDLVKELNLNTFELTDYTTVEKDSLIYMDILTDSISGESGLKDIDMFTDGRRCEVTDSGVFKLDGVERSWNDATYEGVSCTDDDYVVLAGRATSGKLLMQVYSPNDGLFASTDPQARSVPTGGAGSVSNVVFVAKESVGGVMMDVIYWIPNGAIYRYHINDKRLLIFDSKVDLDSDNRMYNMTHSDYSGYKLNKRIYSQNNGTPFLKFSIILDNDDDSIGLHRKTITYSTEDFIDNWYFFVLQKDLSSTTGTTKLYINGKKKIDEPNHPGDRIDYYIGSSLLIGGRSIAGKGVGDTLNVSNRNWVGALSEFTIYDVTLSDSDIETMYTSKFTRGEAMTWVLSGSKKYFVEEVQRMFKFKKPGIKTKLINIVIKNIDVADADKAGYEAEIRSGLDENLPANTKIVNFIWR